MNGRRAVPRAARVGAAGRWSLLAGVVLPLPTVRPEDAQLPTRGVAPPVVTGVTVQPTGGAGGAPRTGTVTLDGAATAGTGTTVTLRATVAGKTVSTIVTLQP
jgi:hypothetical protein